MIDRKLSADDDIISDWKLRLLCPKTNYLFRINFLVLFIVWSARTVINFTLGNPLGLQANVSRNILQYHKIFLYLSTVSEHLKTSKHHFDPEKVNILAREPKDFARKILEAIHIRKEKPILNRYIDK